MAGCTHNAPTQLPSTIKCTCAGINATNISTVTRLMVLRHGVYQIKTPMPISARPLMMLMPS